MILFTDSFSHYAVGDATQKWTARIGPSISAGTGKYGSDSLRVTTNGDYCRKDLTVAAGVVTAGFWVRIASLATFGTGLLCNFGEVSSGGSGFAGHVGVVVLSDGSVRAVRCTNGFFTVTGATTLGTSSAGLVTDNTFVHIQLQALVHDSTGTITIKVNDTAVITLTGQDTRNGQNGYITYVTLGAHGAAASTVDFSDFWVTDTSGSVNTSFLGASRVLARRMQAGNGANTGSTPSTGSDRGAMVSDTTPDGDSTYNIFSSSGQKDTYTKAALGVTGTILGVQIVASLKKSDDGVAIAKLVTRSGGTDTLGSDVTPAAAAYEMQMEVRETDPNTSTAWTVTGIDNAEFGLSRAA